MNCKSNLTLNLNVNLRCNLTLKLKLNLNLNFNLNLNLNLNLSLNLNLKLTLSLGLSSKIHGCKTCTESAYRKYNSFFDLKTKRILKIFHFSCFNFITKIEKWNNFWNSFFDLKSKNEFEYFDFCFLKLILNQNRFQKSFFSIRALKVPFNFHFKIRMKKEIFMYFNFDSKLKIEKW